MIDLESHRPEIAERCAVYGVSDVDAVMRTIRDAIDDMHDKGVLADDHVLYLIPNSARVAIMKQSEVDEDRRIQAGLGYSPEKKAQLQAFGEWMGLVQKSARRVTGEDL